MALVVISGFPCAGKTTRAMEIKEMLESRLQEDDSITLKDVVIVNDELLGVHRSSYNDSKSEKVARGHLLSHTIRYLSKNRIVLCDGMNYIKGFRYQLYCAAREAGVRNCTVHVAAIPSDCISRNASLSDETRYQEQTIGNLISRFEEPNGSTRWDSPLVVFPWCDSLVASHSGNSDGLAGNLEGLRVIDECQAPSDDTSLTTRHPKLNAKKNESTGTQLLLNFFEMYQVIR
ncbi:chromatin associated protein KTI12-domain-containing protein [Melampsora americana]|nr:chromatin associated protein KTI12-domain-containing protein [Melampsora americana]